MKISQEVMNPIQATLSTNRVSKNETSHSEVIDANETQAIAVEQTNNQEKSEIQVKDMIKAIEEANQKIKDDGKQFEFSVHEQTKQIMIKVIDTKTHKVLKEFPSEKILDMVANMCEAAGIFVDEKR